MTRLPWTRGNFQTIRISNDSEDALPGWAESELETESSPAVGGSGSRSLGGMNGVRRAHLLRSYGAVIVESENALPRCGFWIVIGAEEITARRGREWIDGA